MANRLKMAMIEAILRLHQQGWSNRRIARELGLDRDTVARQLRAGPAKSNAAISLTGSEAASGESNAAIPLTGFLGGGQAPNAAAGEPETPDSGQPAGGDSQRAAAPAGKGRGSECEPWRAVIRAKLDQGLSAQRIYQDLVSEHGFSASYYSVQRFVRRLGVGRALPFRRLECAAGEEAQVDFGTGIPITSPDGKRRQTHVFRIVLSHSRKGYSEAVHRQSTEEFLRCLENAFGYFGGVPRTLVLDNLKAGVLVPDWFDAELNPKLRAFADHYGLALLPNRPRMPRHKGKIESGIGYVKKNALKGHVFTSLEEENRHLRDWEAGVADRRLHGTTRQQVGTVFAAVERAALLPLPAERFPFFHEGQRTVQRDGHVDVAKAYYSAPPEYLGRRVWARWDGRLVRLFNERFEPIAVHVRQEPGRFSTQPAHIASEKINDVERGAAWLLAKAKRIGRRAAEWGEAVIRVRGVEGLRPLQGLLSLTKKHSSEAIDRACDTALSYESYHLRTIRTLLQRQAAKQESFEFLDTHPLIRSLADYQQLVHAACQAPR